MKITSKVVLAFTMALLFCGCKEEWEKTGKMTLAECGKPAKYTIVLPYELSPSQAKAASELQHFIGEITGVQLPIATNAHPKRAIFLGGGDESLGEDGFRLVAKPPHFYIEGSKVHGTLFGVYDFLERYCGCEWLATDTTIVPKTGAVRVSATLNDRQIPAFKLRDANWTDHLRDHVLEARLKMDGFRIEYPEELGGRPWRKDTTTGGATFEVLCPPSKYFKDHPEWFALLDGKRKGPNSQRCLTNKGFLDFLVDNVRTRIRKNYPACKYYSLYQNDWKNACECPDCKAIDEREGTPMGTMLYMANYVAEKIAKDYPDVTIITFSYMYTLKPPKTLKPHPNVMICYCTDQCDFSKPIVESKWHGCKSFVEDFKNWRKICDKLYIWDYSANFQYLDSPFEFLHVLPDNLKFFRDIGVEGVFEEGDHYRTHGTDEQLKTWVMAHLMWNPDEPLEGLLNRFFKGYYGPAAETARAYYDALVQLELKRDEAKKPLSMWGVLEDIYIPVAFLDEWSKRWEAAMESVKNEPLYHKHVHWALNRIDWVRVLRSKARSKFVLSSNPQKDIEGAEDLIRSAKRLLKDAEAEPESLHLRPERRKKILEPVKTMANLDPKSIKASSKVSIGAEDLDFHANLGGSLVNDKKAIGGKALRIDPSAKNPPWQIGFIKESELIKDDNARIAARVHVRIEKGTDLKGNAFSVGTCQNQNYSKRDIATFQVKVADIPDDDEYHWYDVEGVWSPRGGEVFWLGNGYYSNSKYGSNPAVKGIFFDQVELRLQ